jgi:hypothetical protein
MEKILKEKIILKELKKISSLIKEDVNSGFDDPCYAKYNFPALQNQIGKFQKWIWDYKDSSRKVVVNSDKEDYRTYKTSLCSSVCTKRQAIDGIWSTITSGLWKTYGTTYRKLFAGTWCEHDKNMAIWFNGIEVPVVSQIQIKGFQRFVWQEMEKLPVDPVKTQKSVLCPKGYNVCTFSQAVDGSAGDSFYNAWKLYGEKYKLKNPKWDDKDVTYEPNKPIDKVDPKKVYVDNTGLYFDENQQAFVDALWLDWELGAYLTSSGEGNPLNSNSNFRYKLHNLGGNTGIYVSIPYKTEFGSSKVLFYYMKRKGNNVHSDYVITVDGRYFQVVGLGSNLQEKNIDKNPFVTNYRKTFIDGKTGTKIWDKIKDGFIPLPDGYVRLVDRNGTMSTNATSLGAMNVRPDLYIPNKGDKINFNDITRRDAWVIDNENPIKTQGYNQPPKPYVPPMLLVGNNENKEKWTYKEWRKIRYGSAINLNFSTGRYEVQKQYDWSKLDIDDITSMGIVAPFEHGQEILSALPSWYKLEDCPKKTVFDGPVQKQIEDPACATRNQQMKNRLSEWQKGQGTSGKYFFWGWYSSDLNELKKSYQEIIEDWNNDHKYFIGNQFLDKNGKLKTGAELEKAKKEAKDKANYGISSKENGYEIPSGIAYEDGPDYLVERDLIIAAMNAEIEADQLAYERKYADAPLKPSGGLISPNGSFISLKYSEKLTILKNKYTTRIYGTEMLSKEAYVKYLNDRSLAEKYYQEMKKPYQEKLSFLRQEEQEENRNWERKNMNLDALRVDPSYTGVKFDNTFQIQRKKQITEYENQVDYYENQIKFAYDAIDKKWDVKSLEKSPDEYKKQVAQEMKEPKEPEYLGIKSSTWHTFLNIAGMAALIIPGLQGVGLTMRIGAGVMAAEVTLGGAINFAVNLADAGIYLHEKNYQGAGFALILSTLGIKADWNVIANAFHKVTEVVVYGVKTVGLPIISTVEFGIKKLAEITGKAVPDVVKNMIMPVIQKGKDAIINAYQEFKVAISNYWEEKYVVESGKGKIKWDKLYKRSWVPAGDDALQETLRRASILEETLYNTIQSARSGLSKISGMVLTKEGAIETATSIGMFTAFHHQYEKTYEEYFDNENDFCKVIDEKLVNDDGTLGRGRGACGVYMYAFGVRCRCLDEKETKWSSQCCMTNRQMGDEDVNQDDLKLLKRAIIEQDWKPGMMIFPQYITEESKNRQQERKGYQEAMEIFGPNGQVHQQQRKKNLPEPFVKKVYVFVDEKLPERGSEDWNTRLEIELQKQRKKVDKEWEEILDTPDKEWLEAAIKETKECCIKLGYTWKPGPVKGIRNGVEINFTLGACFKDDQLIEGFEKDCIDEKIENLEKTDIYSDKIELGERWVFKKTGDFIY